MSLPFEIAIRFLLLKHTSIHYFEEYDSNASLFYKLSVTLVSTSVCTFNTMYKMLNIVNDNMVKSSV